MGASQNNNPNTRNTRAVRARADKQKKKVIAAVCLVVFMAVLWGRVLLKKPKSGGVSTVSAAPVRANLPTANDNAITYRELLYVEARHDRLVKDVFASNGWKGFKKLGQNNNYGNFETNVKDMDDEMAAAAAKELELIAIVTGAQHQAFIGDELVVRGQSFNFMFQGEKYVFKVLSINDEQVELECGGAVVVKKMVQPAQMNQ
ncbi:MAG: hypothetical protein K8R02_05370 [Anaerohalosphaeraceae bacterium]|nr:hypothetical protein [Anaerohalosphaeraceae bacterium]